MNEIIFRNRLRVVDQVFMPLAIALFIAFPSDLQAADTIVNPQITDLTRITSADGAQQFPDVAYNSQANNFLVVWENALADTYFEIEGVVVDAAGKPIGELVLLLTDNQSIEAPEVTYNSVDNEFLLVARRKNDDQVLALRITPQGQPIGDYMEIGRSSGPTFFDPAARARICSVAYNAQENRYIVGFGDPVSARIFFSDLTLEIESGPLGTGTNPSVAWSSKSNRYLLAYEDRESRSTGSENLSAILLSNAIEAIGDMIRMRDQEFAEESPRVAYNPDDDQFLIVWDERIGFSENVQPQTLTDTIGQIVSVDGTLAGGTVPIEAGTAYTLRQDVDYNPAAGLYLAVWKGDPSGDFAFADIYGRFLHRDGSLASDIFLIHDGGDDNTDRGTSEQYYDESKLPAVAANLQDGSFLVVWEEAGTSQNPDIRDIQARVVRIHSTSIVDWEVWD